MPEPAQIHNNGLAWFSMSLDKHSSFGRLKFDFARYKHILDSILAVAKYVEQNPLNEEPCEEFVSANVNRRSNEVFFAFFLMEVL